MQWLESSDALYNQKDILFRIIIIVKLVTHKFERGRFARTLIVPVNWLFCRYLQVYEKD